MGALSRGTEVAATNTNDNSGIVSSRRNGIGDGGIKDDRYAENWFAVSCGSLYQQKAGTALHYVTQVDERSCQRYAAGHVKPPATFLRLLLRSDHGWQWLSAAMEGCELSWWLELQAARELLLQFEIRSRTKS